MDTQTLPISSGETPSVIQTPVSSSASGVAKKRQRGKTAAILSFDGGGTKGAMELVMLDAIFRMATLIVKKTEEMPSVKEILTTKVSSSGGIFETLSVIEEPIHPTAAFDMIVGTSTGGIISMGLLAGNKGKDRRREKMSVDEVKHIYLNEAEKMFSTSSWPWYCILPRCCGLFRANKSMIPYSQKNFEEIVTSVFGDAKLKDVDDKCIGGCVAKSVGEDDEEEELKFFNTVSLADREIPISKVLLATGDAPVYFEGPVQIGDRYFVDGGVGGNCPLKQAIPTAKALLGYDVDLFVVSLAPPQKPKKPVPRNVGKQLAYWMKYFPSQVTSGGLIYNELKSDYYAKSARFYRLVPKGKDLSGFNMDDKDVQAMLQATEDWVNGDGMYEILPLVFAVVAELLWREEVAEARESPQAQSNHHSDERVTQRKKIHDWIKDNYQSLMTFIEKKEGMKNKLETVKYLLLSVQSALEAFDGEKFSDTRANTLPVLKELGKTTTLMGNPKEAANYYAQVLELLRDKDPTDRQNQISLAEVHFLYSEALFDLGDLDDVSPGGNKGALCHAKKAEEQLKKIEDPRVRGSSSEEEVGDAGYLKFLRKSALLQIGKIYMNLGDYERALKQLELCFSQSGRSDDDDENGMKNNRWVALVKRMTQERQEVDRKSGGRVSERFKKLTSVIGRQVDFDASDLDILHNIGLSLFKSGDRQEARKAFDAAASLYFDAAVRTAQEMEKEMEKKDCNMRICPWLKTTCKGFVCLIDGKPSEACDEFGESLKEIQRNAGKMHPHSATAAIFSYIGLAAYEGNMLEESLINLRRAKNNLLLMDDDQIHPILGAVNSTLGVILTRKKEFRGARQCFEEASKQFEHIHKRLLDDKKTTQEIIGIKNNEACLDFIEGNAANALEKLEKATSLLAQLPLRNEPLETTLKRNQNLVKTAVDSGQIQRSDEPDGVGNSEPEFFILL